MSKVYKNCQSCSMPLKKDPKGGASNKDGTISTIYCSYCYENGEFLQPDITVQQMQDFVKDKLIEMKFPKFLASFFTKGIPKLERWKSKS